MRAAWWWIDRWRKSTAYICMSLEEQGLYRNLLDACWLFEGRPIPDESKALISASGGDAEAWARSGARVLQWMRRVEGGWVNDTADEVRLKGESIHAVRSEAGRRGGLAKQANRIANAVANGVPPSPSPSPSNGRVVGDGVSKRESPPPPTPPPNGGGGDRGREQLRLDDDAPEPIPKSKRRRRTGPREPTERETETVAGFLASLNALGRKCRPSPALLLAVQDALDLGYTPAQLRVQPLIAHAHFSDGRVLRLAPEVLLRPGGNGTFAWLSLLGKADSITLPPKLVKVARDLGVASTLESMHVTLNTKLL